MATKKKSKKGSRRRRVGAMALNPGSNMIKLGAAALSYFVLANPVNTQVDKLVKGKISNTMLGAIQGGLGAYLLLGPGRSSLIKTLAGGVVAGSGVKRLVDAMKAPVQPAVTGFRNVPVLGGFRNVPVLGSYAPASGNSNSLGSYAVRSGMGVMGSINDGGSGSGLMQNSN